MEEEKIKNVYDDEKIELISEIQCNWQFLNSNLHEMDKKELKYISGFLHGNRVLEENDKSYKEKYECKILKFVK